SGTFITNIADLKAIKFQNHSSVFSFADETQVAIPIADIDSLTFNNEPVSEKISITYDGTQAAIVNPYAGRGVAITAVGAQVSVTANSGISGIEYNLSGSSENGSFSIQSDKNIVLSLNNLSLSSPETPAVEIVSDVPAQINLSGSNALSDAAANSKNAALTGKGALSFAGNGSLEISGLTKHAIASDREITVESGTVQVVSAQTDGFHSEGFAMSDGSLLISSASGDGIDAGGKTIKISGGTIRITSAAEDVKAIKCDGPLTIDGGNITLSVSGKQSKGLSSKSHIYINDGTIGVTTSGTVALTASGSGYDPSYCTAVKCDSTLVINGGEITIQSTSTALGGKGLSADQNIIINGGNINITTAGNGSTYTNTGGTADSYTACCIKSNKDIILNAGYITCQSSGTGGKCISAEGSITIGTINASNDALVVNAGTSGARFQVSGSSGGGGGRPPGGGGQSSTDYANPKAIKSTGNLTVNSGTIRVNCTQATEGGEGMESKGAFVVNGGDIEISSYDDPINGGTSVTINGGYIYASARGNDAIDSNGTLTINGGLIIANGVKGDGEGIDSERTYNINGGTVFATSGSTMCSPTGTQRAVRYQSAKAGQSICVKNSSSEPILMYTVPVISGASSGTTLILVFSVPQLTAGTYTLSYGGTISGGTNTKGYVTGGTYSGGSSKSFTVGSSTNVITVQ
ncbi:MAG: carbohydrate-binding domain-containing protein, partial [Prevotella sp.]|nr:carbohydrate-binding domain-containing protein [Prevotella sp.]